MKVNKFREKYLSLEKEPKVYIASSLIADGGLGVFVKSKIKKNEPITEYCGEIITYYEAQQRMLKCQHSHIRSLFTMRYCIDGRKYKNTGIDICLDVETTREQLDRFCAENGVAAFANDYPSNKTMINCVFDTYNSNKYGDPFQIDIHEKIVFLRAIRDLKVGEELYVSYGKDYWQKDKKN